MAGVFAPNTTGLPDTGCYLIGRGRAFIAELTNGLPGAFRDIGNIPQFNFNNTTETLKHQSSRQGTRVTDKEVVISQEISLSFQADEVNAENMADWLSGSKAAYTNAAIAGFAEHVMITDVELGRWYPIKSSTGARAYGIDASDLTLEKDAGMDVALVEGTDFELDLDNGLVFFKATAANCAAGDEINCTLAANAMAPVVTEIRALTTTTRRVQLMFTGENPANNDETYEIIFNQVALKADGDMQLIGDEWAVMGFTAVVEANATFNANSPYITIRKKAA